MLDVLITVADDTPIEWLQQCRDSVKIAAAHASFAVNVVEVPAVVGNIGQAMWNGIQLSSSEYACWVDDDDYVMSDAFSCFAQYLSSRPAAIFTRSSELYNNGHTEPCTVRHHLAVYRRDFLTKQRDLPTFVAVPNAILLKRAARETDTVDVLKAVYTHRFYLSKGMALRGEHMRSELHR